MVKVLNVAEKPSVAKGITQILSRGHSSSRTGFSQYNRCFDFQCDIAGERVNMTVTSVTGHIMGLEFAPSHRKWHSCDPVELFEAPVIKSIASDKENICKTLRRESRICQRLILWLDCDREGENIAFEVIDVCRKANPRLDIKRARFSSLVPQEIWTAINSLREPNANENDAVDARQEIDLRIGAAFTRFQTLRIQNQSAIESVVSYGPCQFPTLGFVVNAWQRRENFAPEDFWSIKVEITTGNNDDEQSTKKKPSKKKAKKKGNGADYIQETEHAVFNWKRGHLFDRIATLLIYEMCIECPLAVVERVHKAEKLKWRPYPLETVELQKRCSRWLRLTSQRTMHIAEQLYQRGFLSYPRTETNSFPNGMDLRALVQQHRNSNQWGQYAMRLLDQDAFRNPTRGKKDDKAHPPIHPTKFDQHQFDNFNADEKKVYEFVVRHFLACVSDHARGHESKVTINIAGEQFTTTGLIILERNYLDIYRYERWNTKVIPEFLENQSFTPDSIEMTSGRTTAPELLSEEQLIALMDKHGIGTDATMAQHIETIQSRDYAFKRERRFVPKELGIALCNAYERMGKTLNKPYLRSNMESRMKLIAEGRMNKTDFLRDCLNEMKRIFVECKHDVRTLDAAIHELFGGMNANAEAQVIQRGLCTCGQCGQQMALKGRGRMDAARGRRGRGRGRGRSRARGRNRGRGRSNANEYKSRFLHCSSCANASQFNAAQVSNLRMPRGTLTATEHRCPICNYQVLNVKNEETQKEHTVCPFCFCNPPQAQITADNTFSNGFRCFQCKHSACALAKGSAAGGVVTRCNMCNSGGELSLKWIAKLSKFTVGCNKWNEGCKNTIWFPSTIKDGTKVSDVKCNKCGAMKVDLVIDTTSASAPLGSAPNHTGCVMPQCDAIFSELLEFERQSRFGGGSARPNSNNNANRNRNNNANNASFNRANRNRNNNANNANNGNAAAAAGNRYRNNSRSIGSSRLIQTRINAFPSNGEGFLVGSSGRGFTSNMYNNNTNNNRNVNNRANNVNDGAQANAFSFMMNNNRGKKGKRGRGKKKNTKATGRRKRGRGRGRGRKN